MGVASMSSTPIAEPFHRPGSTAMPDVVRRGAPRALVSQRASKPSGVTVELSGRTSPTKLGVGQDDRIFASSSLPTYRRLKAEVPRRLTVDLKAIGPGGGGGGAFS